MVLSYRYFHSAPQFVPATRRFLLSLFTDSAQEVEGKLKRSETAKMELIDAAIERIRSLWPVQARGNEKDAWSTFGKFGPQTVEDWEVECIRQTCSKLN